MGRKSRLPGLHGDSHSGIWIWSLDRHASPRQLQTAEADTPIFARNGEILFSMKEGAFHYIFRMKQDGTDLRKAIPDPSPISSACRLMTDGSWLRVDGNSGRSQIVFGYPMGGGLPRVLCRVCAVGSFGIGPPIVSWSFDQRSMYISLTHTGANDKPKTMVIPVNPNDAFPAGGASWSPIRNCRECRASVCSTFPACSLGRMPRTTRSGDSVPNATSIALVCLDCSAWQGLRKQVKFLQKRYAGAQKSSNGARLSFSVADFATTIVRGKKIAAS